MFITSITSGCDVLGCITWAFWPNIVRWGILSCNNWLEKKWEAGSKTRLWAHLFLSSAYELWSLWISAYQSLVFSVCLFFFCFIYICFSLLFQNCFFPFHSLFSSSSCFRATCMIPVNFNMPSLLFPVEDDLFLLGYNLNNYMVHTTAFPGFSKNN